MRRQVAFLGAVCLVILLLVAASSFIGIRVFYQPGPLLVTKNIMVPKGNTQKVLQILQDEQVLPKGILVKGIFRLSVFLTRNKGALHSAEFTFPMHVSMQQAIFILRNATPVQHKLTIAEGLTAIQIKSIIDHAPYMEGEITEPKEGSVLPQTYNYEWGISREQFLKRIQNAMRKKLADIWKNREVIDQVNSPQALLILASIVERETAVKIERPKIARVFINRLRIGMKLQSDPTVIYALTMGRDPLPDPLSRDDLEIQSPYNTYWVKGLPPSPICSPGEASLYAVAHPDEGNMLYFVANGTGGHSFATTLIEHERNNAARKILLHHKKQ